MGDNNPYALEEFKNLQQKIVERERTQVSVYTNSVIASASLLSLSAGLFFGLRGHGQISTDPFLALVFLAPVLIVVPAMSLLAAQRRDIFRIATFMRVYYDDAGYGSFKNSVVEQGRATSSRWEASDPMVITYVSLILACSGSFLYAVSVTPGTHGHWFFDGWHLCVPILALLWFSVPAISFIKLPRSGQEKMEENWRKTRIAFGEPQHEPTPPGHARDEAR